MIAWPHSNANKTSKLCHVLAFGKSGWTFSKIIMDSMGQPKLHGDVMYNDFILQSALSGSAYRIINMGQSCWVLKECKMGIPILALVLHLRPVPPITDVFTVRQTNTGNAGRNIVLQNRALTDGEFMDPHGAAVNVVMVNLLLEETVHVRVAAKSPKLENVPDWENTVKPGRALATPLDVHMINAFDIFVSAKAKNLNPASWSFSPLGLFCRPELKRGVFDNDNENDDDDDDKMEVICDPLTVLFQVDGSEQARQNFRQNYLDLRDSKIMIPESMRLLTEAVMRLESE